MAVEADEGQQLYGALFLDNSAPDEGPQSGEASSFPCPGTPCLQSMPAEIRNHIYELVFGDEEIDITQSWPGITGTCKRIRTETLPIFLVHNLSASVIDCDGTNLFLRLSSIQELSTEMRALIPNLRVDCDGMLLERKERSVTSAGQSSPRYSYSPNFEFWNDIIQHVAGSGLHPTQLEWPGADATYLSQNLANLSDFYVPAPNTEAIPLEKHIFNTYVLTPLLKRHDIFDSERPPTKVFQQIESWIVTKERSAKFCEQAATRSSGGGRPRLWYKEWSEPEALSPPVSPRPRTCICMRNGARGAARQEGMVERQTQDLTNMRSD